MWDQFLLLKSASEEDDVHSVLLYPVVISMWEKSARRNKSQMPRVQWDDHRCCPGFADEGHYLWNNLKLLFTMYLSYGEFLFLEVLLFSSLILNTCLILQTGCCRKEKEQSCIDLNSLLFHAWMMDCSQWFPDCSHFLPEQHLRLGSEKNTYMAELPRKAEDFVLFCFVLSASKPLVPWEPYIILLLSGAQREPIVVRLGKCEWNMSSCPPNKQMLFSLPTRLTKVLLPTWVVSPSFAAHFLGTKCFGFYYFNQQFALLSA